MRVATRRVTESVPREISAMEEAELRARTMVDALKKCGPGCGLHLKSSGTVVILGPHAYPVSETPTMYSEADLKKAVSLGLIEESKLKLMDKDKRVEIDGYVARR